MSGHTVILSDTHLGLVRRRRRFVQALRPLWKGASHLILNGDVAEIHDPKRRIAAARAVVELSELCELDDVRLTMLSGNHDPLLSDVRHLHMAGGHILVMHGDALHPAIAPWSTTARQMQQIHTDAVEALPDNLRSDLDARLAAVQHASVRQWNQMGDRYTQNGLFHMIIRPWCILRVLAMWRQYPKLADRFATKHAPAARFVIFGHTHHHGIWRLGNRVLINTGSFVFPGRPCAVILGDASLGVYAVYRKTGRYWLAKRPMRTYDLQRDAA